MNNYFLDTNSIIYALNGGLKLPKNNYFVSIITEIELLSYHKLNKEEEKILKQLLANFINIGISEEVKNKTIEIRKNKNLKLPDSIIAASVIVQNAILITSDKKLLNLDFLDVIELKDLV
jgi:predicted nucleic acid-binding protein